MIRFFDLLLSSLALVILLPLLLPIMLILKLSGEGEVFFLQERVGKHREGFKLFKFATMLKDSPNIGFGEITIKNDPRVLPLGTFLRKYKINELPQLWNIFVGDMSIVGPRPMVPKTYATYRPDAQKIINTVKPGLTGIGSIIFRDEERLLDGMKDPIGFYNKNITPYKIDLELWYIKNNSFWLYIKIIFVTAWVVVFPSRNIVDRVFSDIPPRPDYLI